MSLIHKIWMWASIVLMVLGTIIARGFVHNTESSGLGTSIFFSGVTIASIGFGLLFIVVAIVVRNKRQQTNEKESDFLVNSIEYKIESSECEVKKIGCETEVYNLKTRDVETVKREKTVVAYTTDRFGEKTTFYSEAIDKDSKSIEIRFELGVNISLTIHKDNLEEYKLEVHFDD